MSIHRLLAASTAALLVSATALSSEAQAQYSPYYYNHHNGWNNGYRHHNGWSNGGAAAAGVVGGLALGALAAGAARPYGYGYPSYGYAYPSYGYAGGAYGGYGGCYVARQRIFDSWGYPHWRRVRVCD